MRKKQIADATVWRLRAGRGNKSDGEKKQKEKLKKNEDVSGFTAQPADGETVDLENDSWAAEDGDVS